MLVPIALVLLAGYGVLRWRQGARGSSYVPAPKGDAMGAIAARFGVPVEVIVQANGPGFARFYAPNGDPVAFKLPKGVVDNGARPGAQGRYVS